MGNQSKLQKEAMRVLKETSRTFYIPINSLVPVLKKTVASAYLCMRAIDEIEDHEGLAPEPKEHLLRETSKLLSQRFDRQAYESLIEPYASDFPEVTRRLGDWIAFCPQEIREKVQESTSIMAQGMADWVKKNWNINTEDDLDNYTYYVAGLVGVMLSDIWEWYNGTSTDRDLAIAFGRGLQSVNILRNQEEDYERGVEFFPEHWSREDMFQYARRNLRLADDYMKELHTRNIRLFCKIPLVLAKRTLKALERGQEKMTRTEVEAAVEQVKSES
ncbi:squalene/phytoene synthase family protein [Alteribacillus iranensis]|uniref:Farnesyl-diphosphate farnesyltransferase n=1 Tax=Alteribacillus iranensis TaxID=930128 RepID=A0A1I2DRB2_9BACI|nr:phytoene/squalene synthase family protein [Alteribacillus iranensis]SFE83065.1 farnesyl-diphosphate farnesyltransferase [Alteribacillus iranensis]